MKTICTLIALMLSLGNLKAQNTNPEQGKDDRKIYVYCQLVGTTGFMTKKVSIEIDYGQDQFTSGWKRTNVIRDENNKVKKFNSMVDAVNYMAERGWRMNQAYAFAVGNQSVYHYLMEQEITGDEKIELLNNLKKEVQVKD